MRLFCVDIENGWVGYYLPTHPSHQKRNILKIKRNFFAVAIVRGISGDIAHFPSICRRMLWRDLNGLKFTVFLSPAVWMTIPRPIAPVFCASGIPHDIVRNLKSGNIWSFSVQFWTLPIIGSGLDIHILPHSICGRTFLKSGIIESPFPEVGGSDYEGHPDFTPKCSFPFCTFCSGPVFGPCRILRKAGRLGLGQILQKSGARTVNFIAKENWSQHQFPFPTIKQECYYRKGANGTGQFSFALLFNIKF